MQYLPEPEEINIFLSKNEKTDWQPFMEIPWRDFDVYSLVPRVNSSFSDKTKPEFPLFLLCPTIPSNNFGFQIYEDRKLILTQYLERVQDCEDIESLTTNQLLCNKHFVSHLDAVGRDLFSDWNLNAFICGKMGSGDYRPDLDLALFDYSDIHGLMLNGPGEIHYGYELFLKPRNYWPLRGAPFFWCEMARILTDCMLPLSNSQIDEVVLEMRARYGIPKEGEQPVYVPDYLVGVHSGMSSGMVTPDGIKEMVNDIKHRNSLYAEAPEKFIKNNVRRFEEFPYL